MPPLPSHLDATRRLLRQRLRACRTALSAETAHAAARACAAHLASSALFQAAETIAAYVSVDRELDPTPLIESVLAAGKAVYLPRLKDSESMEFIAWRTGDVLAPNRFGIPEPACRNAAKLSPESLDLVLVPLLGFDSDGNRLGFGGGFYDRAFAFRRRRNAPPVLCGYAYEEQHCEALESASWDVSLDAIVTQDGLRFFSGSGRAE